jgi:hypothetical protein
MRSGKCVVVVTAAVVTACASSIAAPVAPTVVATSIAAGTTSFAASPSTSTELPAGSLPGRAVAPPVAAPVVADAPAARLWIEATEQTVRLDAPGPPTSARRYAYVAAAYADARSVGTAAEASEVARRVLRAVAPDRGDVADATGVRVGAAAVLPAAVDDVAARYLQRAAGDGWAGDDPTAAMATAATGPGHWVRVAGKGPLDSRAGTWRRWLVPDGQDFDVPEPPAFGTPAYRAQQQLVVDATRRRDALWQAVIEFWGGTPGTQAPAGIWLDRLWTVAQGTPLATDDVALARAQSALTRAIADAFMECWRVKYTWWTARPSMSDPSIAVAMANPPFPGYVSGHSTISAAAASVISWLVPAEHDRWWADAAQARDSRLVAGIHFPVDNEVGFALGTRVGDLAVARLREGA